MADKRAAGRSLDEWMDLVTECRQSGLSSGRQLCTDRSGSGVFFVKHFSLKKASEFPVFSKGFSLL